MRRSPFLLALPIFALMLGCDPTSNPPSGQKARSQLAFYQDPQRRVKQAFGEPYIQNGIDAYVKRIGARIVASLPPSEANRSYSFSVLDTPLANAFAKADGSIYVTRGMIALTRDEAELASILAHEIGHVRGDHLAQRRERVEAIRSRALEKMRAAQVSGQRFGEVLEVGLKEVAASTVNLAAFSREQELEADRLGITALTGAGYSSLSQARLFGRMMRYTALQKRLALVLPGTTPVPGFLRTHPATDERIQLAEKFVLENATDRTQGDVETDRHMTVIDGLAYGMSLQNGVVRNSHFYSAGQNWPAFRFKINPGWRRITIPNTALFVSLENDSAISFHVIPREERKRFGKPPPVLTAIKRLKGPEPSEISGYPTKISSGTGMLNGELIYWTDVEIEYEGVFCLFRSAALDPETMQRDINAVALSFQQVLGQSVRGLRPRQLHTRRASGADTMSSLIDESAFLVSKEEYIRIMNDLEPTEQIVPGSWVKLVK